MRQQELFTPVPESSVDPEEIKERAVALELNGLPVADAFKVLALAMARFLWLEGSFARGGCRDVRFAPKSGPAQRRHRCPLSAISRHSLVMRAGNVQKET